MARSSPALRARRLARRLAALQCVSTVLATATDADEVSRLTLETAVEVLGAEAGSLLLHDATRRILRFRHVIGATPEIEAKLRGLELPDTAGLSGRVMQTKRGLIVADVAQDKGHNRTVDARTEYRTRGLLAAPLTSPGGGVLGVLEVLNARGRAFDRDDLGVLCLLAAQAGTALETARLHRAAALASVAHRIGDMSHDVKNLLTPVGTGVKTLRMLLDDTFQAADAAPPAPDGPLANALGELRSMGPELIELALSGVTDVQERVREIADAVKGIVSTPVFEATDVGALVQAVARVLYPVADPAGVALDIAGVGALPPIVVDRRRIYNCLYNLIHNAIPETPPGGTVWVSARRVLADDGAPWLELVVRDDGRGMSEQVRARLFSDDAVSTKPGGTGLGTRIVRGAVEAHGGTVHVASAPGAGARFTLSIPWKSPP
jgi:signal transduction histidine kinase